MKVRKMTYSESGKLGSLKMAVVMRARCRERVRKYKKNPTLCGFCDKAMDYSRRWNKYCSHSCSAKATNLGKRKNYNPHNLMKWRRKCPLCGKNTRFGKRHCSTLCRMKHTHDVYIQKWISGKENGVTGKCRTSSHIRKYYFEVSKGKCQKCGWSKRNPKTGKIPLTLNHKDGNWKNNKKENLELICPNCHSLTPTYCALNKGQGRKFRGR